MKDRERVAQEDRRAGRGRLTIETLYRDHARTVLRWVIRLGGPHLDSQDVAHEVFAVAIRRWATFRADASESAWLYGITRRVVANARRRLRLRRMLGLSDVSPPTSTEPAADDVLARQQQRILVQQVLEDLSDAHREALVLVDMEGRTAPEVGELLGISPGTVYSRVHHARRRFAEAMRRRGHEVRDGAIERVFG